MLKKNILIALLLALALRLININQSLWLDEAIAVQAVSGTSFSDFINHFLPKDVHPPLYQLILFGWNKIFPSTEFFFRLPSIIFGLLTCWFVYRIYQLVFKNEKEALLSLILLTTSPLHIYYSQEARMYSLAAFTTSASMYYFIQLLKKKNPPSYILYIVSTILMLYSHYLCWLILPAQWLYFFYFQNKKLKRKFTEL